MVRLVQSATLETVQGIVKTLKDSFGFIERADMEKDVSTISSFFAAISVLFFFTLPCSSLSDPHPIGFFYPFLPLDRYSSTIVS